MAYYANGASVRQIDAQLFAAWVAAGNPKATGWTLIADPPSTRHSWNGSAWVGPSLATLKSERIAQINAECTQRILAVWPMEKQISATLGIYGATELAAMTDFIDAHIAASNTATSAVFDAPNQAAMEAVSVSWPV
jgi:hypothetical protein